MSVRIRKLASPAASTRALAKAFLIMVILSSQLVMALPATAASLTSTSFTVMDPRTSIAGNRYDWGFSTASSNTLSRVTMGVPAGTTGPNRYLATSGTAYNYASTPDVPANSIAGPIDIRVKANLANWASGSYQDFMNKWTDGSGTASYLFRMDGGGTLHFTWSTDGNSSDTTDMYAHPTLTNGTATWLRATLDPNVSSNSVANLYTSSDGTNWTLVGNNTFTGQLPVYDSAQPITFGGRSDNNGEDVKGKIYYGDARNSIMGTTTSPSACTASNVAFCFNPSNDNVGGTSWAAQSTGETWTVNRGGTNLPADIASDLSVMNVTGLPSGGTAQNREIDGIAAYVFSTATAVSSATAASLGLAGFTNTNTAGSYTSAITTYDNSGTPAAVDTATTASVAIGGNTISTAFGKAADYTTSTAVANVNATIPVGSVVFGTTMYVSDMFTNVILKVNLSTGMATRYAGTTGVAGFSGDGGLATSALLNAPQRLAVDTSGNLYIADGGNNRIRKVTLSNGNISTVAGNGTNGAAGDGAAATAANLSGPQGVAVASNGDIYIADQGNNKIRKVDHTSLYISTIAGTGTSGYSGDGGTATSATFKNLVTVNVDGNGDLYISDYGNAEVRKLTFSTGNITKVVGNGTCAYAGDGGLATSAQICGPDGVAFGANGDAYVVDCANNRIRKITAATGNISTFSGSGTPAFGGDGGAASTGVLSYPRSPTIDSSGNLYFADNGNSRIREISSGGTISTYVGTGQDTDYGDGGLASAAQFYQTTSLASDSSGNTYVADSSDNRIRKIDQWGVITTVAGAGSRVASGSSGDGAAATAALLHTPQGIAVTSNGDIYISDTANNEIRKIDHTTGYISSFATVTSPTHLSVNPVTGDLYVILSATCQVEKVTMAAVQTVVAGTGTCTYNVDSATSPTTVALANPKDVEFDAAGDYYIADKDNSRIRKVDAVTGALSTVAGGGALTSNNVAATSASLSAPRSLAVDALGNVYESEDGSYKIRKFVDGGAIVTVAGSGSSGYSGDGGVATSATFLANNWLTIVRGQLYSASYYTNVVRMISNVAPLTPNVNADAETVPMNTARSWPILSNDWSQSGEMDPNSVSVTSAPTHGTVTLTVPTTEASTLQANYTPTASYTGADSFTYQACDTTKVLCSTATVSITVTSNQVLNIAGGITEGLAQNIGFQATRATRFRNYLFLWDSTSAYNTGGSSKITYSVIRRYDIYSKQLVVIAGDGINRYTTGGVPATSTSISGGDMAFAPDGTLYFADNNNNRIRAIALNGTISTAAGTGTAGTPTAGTAATSSMVNLPQSVVFDSLGNLNFTSGSQIWRFPIGGNMTLVAGAGTAGTTGDGGAATSALLNLPTDMAFDAAGDLYISDSGNNSIRRVTSGAITTVAGTSGTSGSTGNGAAATGALLNNPQGITVDSVGTIYVADTGNNALRSFTDGGTINAVTGVGSRSVTDVITSSTTGSVYVCNTGAYQVALISSGVYNGLTNSTGATNPYSGEGIPALSAQLTETPSTNIYSYAVDATGNIYIGGAGARIRKVDAGTGLVSTYVGNGGSANDYDHVGNGVGRMIFDSSGRLVFVDATNNEVRRVNANLTITTLAGTGTAGFSGDGGLATGAKLNVPQAIAYDAAGNLFISDGADARIREVSAATNYISTVVGTGTSSSTGDGGPGTAATISTSVYSIATDSAGNLYMLDKASNAVRMLDTRGIITTIAGTGTASYSGDGGPAKAATFSSPSGMAIDAAGNIFIADTSNQRIRKIDATTGIVSTVLGNGTSSFSNVADGSTTAAALFPSPRSIYVANGNLYIWGDDVMRIREAVGLAATAATTVGSVTATVVPAASGHNNLRDRFVVTPASTTTSSKMSFSMPTSFAATPTVVSAYGLTGTVTASLTSGVLTVSYPSQSLTAGVPVGISIEGITNGGSNGSYSSVVDLYDSAGSAVTGATRATIVTLTSSGAPTSIDAGYASMWQKSLTATSISNASINISPAGTADSIAIVTLATGGNLNANTVSLGASALSGTYGTVGAVTPDQSTSVASASFTADSWGVQTTSTTGTNAGATGLGRYSGLSSSPGIVVTSAAAANTVTLTPRVKVDYLTAAGSYVNTLTWALTPGS